MMRRDPALPEQYPVREADEFQFALTYEDRAHLYGYLRPNSARITPEGADHQADQYERGVIAYISRSTGESRVTYQLDDFAPPSDPDDVYVTDGGLKFSPGYRARAKNAIKYDPRKGIAYFHSHPGWSAYPSGPDLEADRKRLKRDGRRLDGNRPLAAGIVATESRRETGQPEWSVRAYEFDTDDASSAEYTHATAVRVLGMHTFEKHRDGPYLEKLATPFSVQGPAGPGLGRATVAHDSALELWGERGQARLSGIRVGVVGCGGVGSLLAEQVARLGVGEAVFIDFDHLKEANLNRAYSATRTDARDQASKVEIARRIAERAATAPGFQAHTVTGSVVENRNSEYAALGALLDCDVILNAADPHWVRMVIDHVAYAHLIPVVTGGTRLEVDEKGGGLTSAARSTVATAGPSLPCLHCLNVWKHGDRTAGVVHDRKRPNERAPGGDLYVARDGADIGDGSGELRDPSVITTNGVVASLMMERFHALTVGTSPSTFEGRQVYRPAQGTMTWMKNKEGERQKTCDDGCDRASTVGLGDYVDLATGYDYDLRAEVPAADG
jgi:hypothetical protein